MDISEMAKLPFHDVYYVADPMPANEDLKALFTDSTRFHDEEIAKDAFVYFVRTARKYGFQLFFKAPAGFFNTSLAEPFNGGYITPKTHLQYKGLPDFKFSAKFN